MMTLKEYLDQAWNKYTVLAPDASKILKLLSGRGETLNNEHVAYRTVNHPGINRLDCGKVFQNWGDKPVENLDFPEKKLIATYWVHPDSRLPKIFISELLVEQ